MSVEFFRVGQESGGVNKPGAASEIFRRTSSRNQFDLVLPGKGHGAHRCELYEFAQEVHGVSAGDYLYLHIRFNMPIYNQHGVFATSWRSTACLEFTIMDYT